MIVWLALTALTADTNRTVAFRDVTVIPILTPGARPNQTVVVRNGRITWIGPTAQARLPKGTVQIEGGGGFLLPGFADMHVHPGRAEDLLTFVANGITTVRVMWGDEEGLGWRKAIDRGVMLGPRLVMAGQILDGDPPSMPAMRVLTNPAEARAEVMKQHRQGFDFIKVYNSLPAAVYDTVVKVARELRMPVAGHVPFAVALAGALASKQASIEHLRGYVAELVPKDAPVQPGPSLRSRSVVWNYIDRARIPALVARTRAAGVWNCPTLVVTTLDLEPAAEHAKVMSRPEARFFSPADRSTISYLKDFTDRDYQEAQRGLEGQLAVVAALSKGGAKLLLGTDSWLQGFALQDELELFERAGISRAEVLRLATAGAAEFFHERGQWGEVAVGRRADLQLVARSPLESLGNLRDRVGVMVRGKWYPRAELDQMLEQLAQGRRQPQD